MEKETIEYLYRHYLHLLPLEEKHTLKYPHLQPHEVDEEEERLAKLIATKYKDQVFMNLCPKCRKLARTPMAKQCRYFFYEWS